MLSSSMEMYRAPKILFWEITKRQGAKALGNQPPGEELFLHPRPLTCSVGWLSSAFHLHLSGSGGAPENQGHASQQVCREHLVGVLSSY